MSVENENDSLEVAREDIIEGNHSRSGPSKLCVCPKCGTLVSHQTETPCYKMSCPKCGLKMLSM